MGVYPEGDECTLTATPSEGFLFVNWTEDGEVVSTEATYTFTVTGDHALVANFQFNPSEGGLGGQFTVSEGHQVYFSQGNLQYQASTNTWRFAENQWDILTEANSNVSSTYDGWIDLFCWGTSGYNHGANCYQPWSTSEYNENYWAYGNPSANLYEQSGQADWGYNAISNGGNQENSGWRTLTQEEWYFVFDNRYTPSGYRYAKAIVNGYGGVVIFPDSWDVSLYDFNVNR